MSEAALAKKLLTWYDAHQRRLPWRALPSKQPIPYHVWLSEIMLQQTTVATVKPYFLAFIQRWPNFAALAKADLDDVRTAWAGLGYYSRAKNLHACAKIIATDYGGKLPLTEAELIKLPGIGPYTAAAIAAIAFNQPATVVDGNVERVVARLFNVQAPLPKVKPELRRLAATLTPQKRAGDLAQAMMDLGATICTPRTPTCRACPWQKNCAAFAAGTAAALPRRAPKITKPVRHTTAFLITDKAGRVLLRKRPERGLLAGLYEVPSTPWDTNLKTGAATASAKSAGKPPLRAKFAPLKATARHVFTHFTLEITAQHARITQLPKNLGNQYVWAARADFSRLAIPTVTRKMLRLMETN